jgi:VWFA-related protein
MSSARVFFRSSSSVLSISFSLVPSITAIVFCLCASATAQRQLPYMDAGNNSAFVQLDFAEMYLDQQAWAADTATSARIQSQGLADSGVVSALDLQAPEKAVQQFDRGTSALKSQNSKDAIRYLQKAIGIYPQFVSAHTALGLAYSDQKDVVRAREEFESATKLDDSLPTPFLNLGILALSAQDFASAESNLAKAASLSGKNPKILTALAFAQNGDHKYADSLRTAERVHAMKHQGLANVHYIAASAAMSLGDQVESRRELSTFISEDPTNPLAPVARQRLSGSETKQADSSRASSSSTPAQPGSASITMIQTFPNSQHLQAQLRAVSDDAEADADENACDTCGSETPEPESASPPRPAPPQTSTFVSWRNVFTIRQTVDETALFFAVSHHGHPVNDLSLSDIQVRDDDKAPDKILQFVPQSKLPLRLGLLLDTSDSVSGRFLFEKRAAQEFIRKVINNSSDLAFVGGFNDTVSVTQDFTGDTALLSNGIEKIARGGETSVFDAIYYACWKLAAYPEEGRVARVLVVLTDGEDNSSHRSLRQAIEQAEASGVTIYTLNTAQVKTVDTDASEVLRILAERSGGESIFPGSLPALDKYLNKLPDVIRSRYLIAYRPADFSADGKYRPIRVTASKNGKRFKVHVRKGYYARMDANRTAIAQR